VPFAGTCPTGKTMPCSAPTAPTTPNAARVADTVCGENPRATTGGSVCVLIGESSEMKNVALL
jgi:hypothetical protein